jgi:hypothetical protein
MATRNPSTNPASDATRLANRAAALAFASGFAIIAALVAVSSAFADEGSSHRFAAFAALVVAVGITAWARRARVQLRAARTRPDTASRPANADANVVGSSRPGNEVRPRRERAPLSSR